MGRAEATLELAILAKDNDRTKRIMVEENGIPPLLKMLRETENVDAQSAAAIALCNLTDDPMVVKTIVEGSGVKSIVEVLSEVPMKVQVPIVNLISRILEVDVDGHEEFGKENLAKPLVALLGVDVDLEEFKMIRSLHTLALINKEMMKKHVTNSVGGIHSLKGKEKDREESPKIRLALKVRCADALWKLAKGSSSNSKKITETKALLVLAKIIEIETSELKLNCLKVIMELAAVAERDSGLKRSAFKPNSCTVKVVLDQLLRVINEERNEAMVTLAIKAVGCLASTFSAKEARIVKSLVMQLGCRNLDVASEASKSLCKFVRDDNYNRREHSQAIIESNGVVKILNLMRSKNHGHLHELVLLCNLAMNAGDDKAFEQTQVLTVLERAAIRHTMTQNYALRELFTKAIHQLTIFQAADHTHRHV